MKRLANIIIGIIVGCSGQMQEIPRQDQCRIEYEKAVQGTDIGYEIELEWCKRDHEIGTSSYEWCRNRANEEYIRAKNSAEIIYDMCRR